MKVPYHEASAAYARQLTAGMKTAKEKYDAITNYVSKEIKYDFIRAIKIPKHGGTPDVDHAWRDHMGICLDIAALTTGMLRAAKVPASMCIGKADKQQHAWVEAEIGGRKYRYDHDGKAKAYKTERRY